MTAHFELFEFSDRERAALNDAATRDALRATDGRADGRADCDALQDGRRVGQRIADGFNALTASEK